MGTYNCTQLVDGEFSCWGERLLFGFQLIFPFPCAGRGVWGEGPVSPVALKRKKVMSV